VSPNPYIKLQKMEYFNFTTLHHHPKSVMKYETFHMERLYIWNKEQPSFVLCGSIVVRYYCATYCLFSLYYTILRMINISAIPTEYGIHHIQLKEILYLFNCSKILIVFIGHSIRTYKNLQIYVHTDDFFFYVLIDKSAATICVF